MITRNLNFLCFAGWALLLLAVLALRPSLSSPLAWFLLLPAFLLGGAYMVLAKLDAKKEESAWREWKTRLDTLTDKPDVEDDGHLFEQFDRAEWECIFADLKRQPKEARSLQRAIKAIDPDF